MIFMRQTTPPLNALRAFEAAARHQSFARAAAELFVTPGAISQQVASLEDHLNILLFKRIKQRLEITEAGRSYLIPLKSSLDCIEAATIDLLSYGESGGHLKVGVLPSLATFWLIPRLKQFIKRHPTIQLQIVTLDLNFASADRSPNFEGGLIDVGLFYGDGHWSNLKSEPLQIGERLIAVTAPETLRLSPDSRQNPFETLPLLHHSTRPDSWNEWFQQQNLPTQIPTGPSFEHFYMLIEAAKAGLGIALLPDVFVQSELRRKSLIQISEWSMKAQRAYYIVYDSHKGKDPKINKFRNWLLEDHL